MLFVSKSKSILDKESLFEIIKWLEHSVWKEKEEENVLEIFTESSLIESNLIGWSFHNKKWILQDVPLPY